MTNRDDFLPIYYDAEFTGLHRDTTLISIALVSASGSIFYAEFTDFDRGQLNNWLIGTVISNLLYDPDKGYTVYKEQDIVVDDIKHTNVIISSDRDFISSSLREWLENESDLAGGKKIQIYSDCYAYDIVLLNDLICKDGNALNVPDYLYYIPVDLSTALQMCDKDPDINREEFIGVNVCREIVVAMSAIDDKYKFRGAASAKHNCLWDAYVCKKCFDLIFQDHKTIK